MPNLDLNSRLDFDHLQNKSQSDIIISHHPFLALHRRHRLISRRHLLITETVVLPVILPVNRHFEERIKSVREGSAHKLSTEWRVGEEAASTREPHRKSHTGLSADVESTIARVSQVTAPSFSN